MGRAGQRDGTSGSAGNAFAGIITQKEWAMIEERFKITPQQVDIIQEFIANPGNGKPEAIAKALGIQPCSVKKQVERMYDTMDAHTRVEVIVRVFVEVLRMRA